MLLFFDKLEYTWSTLGKADDLRASQIAPLCEPDQQKVNGSVPLKP